MNKLVCLIIIIVLPALVTADDLAVTVYNSNIGVISETRTMSFEKGFGEIDVTDIPVSIDRTSVRFDIIGKHNISILEQNYQYDLVGESALFKRYLNKNVKLISKNGDIHEGKFLSGSNQSYIILDNSGRVKVLQQENIVVLIVESNFPYLSNNAHSHAVLPL